MLCSFQSFFSEPKVATMPRATTIVLCLLFAPVSSSTTAGNEPSDVVANQYDRYKIRTVRPSASVDFKLIVVSPPFDVDHKLRIIDPSQDASRIVMTPRHSVQPRGGIGFSSPVTRKVTLGKWQR